MNVYVPSSSYLLLFLHFFFMLKTPLAHYPIILPAILTRISFDEPFFTRTALQALLPASINQKGVFKRFLIEKCAAILPSEGGAGIMLQNLKKCLGSFPPNKNKKINNCFSCFYSHDQQKTNLMEKQLFYCMSNIILLMTMKRNNAISCWHITIITHLKMHPIDREKLPHHRK